MLNKQHLPALLAAREIIDSGRIKFICFALTEAADRAAHLAPACYEVKEFVNIQMEGHHLLSTWILDELFPAWENASGVPEPYQSAWYNEDGVFTLARLAWLDRIIADIEALPCAS